MRSCFFPVKCYLVSYVLSGWSVRPFLQDKWHDPYCLGRVVGSTSQALVLPYPVPHPITQPMTSFNYAKNSCSSLLRFSHSNECPWSPAFFIWYIESKALVLNSQSLVSEVAFTRITRRMFPFKFPLNMPFYMEIVI